MKQGDTVPVTISGQVVAQATVKETGEGTVTLVVPATLVVMATRTSIDTVATVPEGEEVPVTTSETVITGVDRVNAEGEVIGTGMPAQPQRVSAADVPAGNGGVAGGTEGASETPQPQGIEVTDPGSAESPTTHVTPTVSDDAGVSPDVADNPPSPA